MTAQKEKQDIVKALDAAKLVAEQFYPWVDARGFKATLPFAGLLSWGGTFGNLTIAIHRLSGTLKIIACVYGPLAVDDQRRGGRPRPDRWGDAHRMRLLPVSKRAPWPGAEILVAGGRSTSGVALSTADVNTIVKDAEEAATEPVEYTVRSIIARAAGSNDPDDIRPDMDLEWDMILERLQLMEDLEDVFHIKVPSGDAEEWGRVSDVVDFVKTRV